MQNHPSAKLLLGFLALELFKVDLFHRLVGRFDKEEHNDDDRKHRRDGEQDDRNGIVLQPLRDTGNNINGVSDFDRHIGRYDCARLLGNGQSNEIRSGKLRREGERGIRVPCVCIVRVVPLFIILGHVAVIHSDLNQAVCIGCIFSEEELLRVLDAIGIGRRRLTFGELARVEIVERVIRRIALEGNDCLLYTSPSPRDLG